jgi:hypothetical protein
VGTKIRSSSRALSGTPPSQRARPGISLARLGSFGPSRPELCRTSENSVMAKFGIAPAQHLGASLAEIGCLEKYYHDFPDPLIILSSCALPHGWGRAIGPGQWALRVNRCAPASCMLRYSCNVTGGGPDAFPPPLQKKGGGDENNREQPF